MSEKSLQVQWLITKLYKDIELMQGGFSVAAKAVGQPGLTLGATSADNDAVIYSTVASQPSRRRRLLRAWRRATFSGPPAS